MKLQYGTFFQKKKIDLVLQNQEVNLVHIGTNFLQTNKCLDGILQE